ncbi:MAG: TRAP transporter large permease subunit, partial [Deltaproteobacteria bacterium]|nr:TRAP transporter large permease subunit [Deltaproteobacteria bacterium]
AAHLFVFYFACISAITPPVCGAVYTACGFSGTSVMQTGWTATRLGISAYIVPFLFVYHPVLMIKGPSLEIIQAAITATIGVAAVSMAIIGTSYVGNIRWNIFQRALFFGAFIGLITPGTRTDLLGILVMSIGILSHPKIWQSSLNFLRNRKKKVIVESE